MPITSGSRLGAYEVLAPLGSGGMGEVYRARDTRLEREVALKILPADLARDADRVRRFEQEARAAAALSHPNILAVYDIGTAQLAGSDQPPVMFVASELLEGTTLRDALAQPVTPGRACAWASQVALGLAAAHAKQIVHRDIKPENLFLTPDGRVKILDFGLARMGGSASAETDTVLQSPRPSTQAGMVLGTVAYMSPEQARGLPADERSDIFSLGVVLYEMLAGKAPFSGASSVESLHATLTSDPPELDSSRAVPATLDRIVRRCLEKRPEDRFHSAHDLALSLEAVGGSRSHASDSTTALQSGTGFVTSARPTVSRPMNSALITALLVAAAGIGAAATYYATRTAPPEFPGFQRITFRRGTVESARFEPGSKNVVYSARWQGDRPAMFSVHPNSPESQAIGPPDAVAVAISTSQQAAVLLSPRLQSGQRSGTLATMPLGGGGARELATNIMAADFMPDGQLAAIEYTGDTNKVHLPIGKVIYQTSDGIVTSLRVAPNGLIAVNNASSITVLDATGAVKSTMRINGIITGMDWSPNGKELWFSVADGLGQSSILGAVPGGTPRRLWRGRSISLQDVAADGTVVVVEESRQGGTLVQKNGSPDAADFSWLDGSVTAQISPAADALLMFEGGDAGGSVYVRKLDGSPAIRLGEGTAMAWAPDGTRVLVAKNPSEYAILPVGAGVAKTIAHPDRWGFFAWFHPDGRMLINGRMKDEPYRFWLMDESGKFTDAGPPGLDHWAGQNPLSNDGRWLCAFKSGQGMAKTAAVYPLDGGEPIPVKGLNANEVAIRFTEGDRHLLVYDRDHLPARIFKLDYRTGERALWREFTPNDPAGISGFGMITMTPDGRVVAYNYIRSLGTAFLVTGLK